MEELSMLGQAALELIDMGFAVFPVAARGKKPVTTHGVNDWTDNPDTVRGWWAEHPNDNVGIACGTPSGGLLVLDFDVDEEKDKDGLATLYEWERVHGELPETAVSVTGSGGLHYLYRTDRTNIHPSTNAELGVDVRCDGSYIVAPPSIHPNGRRYEWQDHPADAPIATANGAVYDFLDHIQRNGGQDETRKENGKFKLPDEIKKGDRDKTLFRYASHLRAIGRSDEEIENAVAGANAMRCKPPMRPSDIVRIVKSACKYERGEDHDAGGMGKPGAKAEAIAPVRGKRGGLQHNNIAKLIIENRMARIIDGAPAIWNGKRWEFGQRAINRCVLEIADDAKKQDKAEVFSYIMDKAPAMSSDTAFDGRYYVQFRNATYDVLAEDVVEPTPEMYIIATLPIDLDLDVPANEADAFIESVADGDARTERALREIIGACECSRRVLSQSPMLIGRAGGGSGKASNGKSTFLNWLRSMLGTENVSSLDIATLGQRFQAGRVVGKLANLGDDIPDCFLKGDELSIFKKLVTGDAIYTDVKNGEGFEFRPSVSMVFSMNAVPRLSDTTDGVFRRLAFVPFRRRFSPGMAGFDPNIARRLTRPEVMQRGALLGLMELGELIHRGSLTDIPDMAVEVEEVRLDNDSVERWIDEEGITASYLNMRPLREVYGNYTEFCRVAGERNPFSMRRFCSRMRDTRSIQGSRILTEETAWDVGSHKTVRVFTVESVEN